MQFSDHIVYVDETGDHGIKSIDSQFPVFGLNFCIFEKTHYYNNFVPRIQKFKFDFFGHDNIILHEHQIVKKKEPFLFLHDDVMRNQFMDELNQIVVNTEVTMISTIVDKRNLVDGYMYPYNPYDLALKFCLERLHRYLHDTSNHVARTHIIVEMRGKNEDEKLRQTFNRVCSGANYGNFVMNFEIVFADKKVNSAGLQLADLTARPIALNYLRPDQPNKAYDIIESKIRRSPDGNVDGWGIKVFP